ncbi:MAG: ATP-binding protein [Ferruginibacter sp.]
MQAEDQQIRLLIIDDDEDDYFITSEYIKAIPNYNFTIEWCYKYKEGLNRICNKEFDLYFIDYLLGPKTGLDLIKEAMSTNCEEPFILLTGKGSKNIDVEAMQAGAVDYLIKSEIDTEKLERAIRYSIERSRSVKAIKANERKFRNIFERSLDTVFIADEALVFKDINHGATKLLQYSKEELLSISLYELLASEDEKETLKDLIAYKKEVDVMELVFKTKTGALKYCILSLSLEQQFAEHYFQGIIHDITNLKKAERATLRMEKRGVADRLVHVLAHEVRNPLNNINLSLEQLSPEFRGSESQIYLDIISRNSKRIEDLITELLSSSGPAQIIEERIPVQQIIDASIVAAHDRLTLKKIRFTKNFPPSPAIIYADAEKLNIALLNIIINAVEAMEQEKGQLSIAVEETGENVLVIIEDNGCGISEENMSRLFEPYFTAKRNGMGLGLASTLNILQSHKAEVEVQSKLNEGTKFILTFKKSAEVKTE